MKKGDEILIQKKIDGTLSNNEEKAFHNLMTNSSEAADLYNKLKLIDQQLKSDVVDMPQIDISSSVMDKVSEIRTRAKAITFSSQNVMKYAAVLLLGLLIGSAFSMLILNDESLSNKQHLSGTMVARQGSVVLYSKGPIKISQQSISATNFSINIFEVETSSVIEFEIHDKAGNFDKQNIIAVQNSYHINNAYFENGTYTGRIKGPVVFQLNAFRNNQLELVFTSENEVLAKVNFE